MKKLYLEFVRGMAALFVLLFHITELYFSQRGSHGFSLSTLAADSVIIFFILSGCVINISQTRRPKKRMEFFVNRLVRIMPQFVLGVGLGLLAIRIIGWAVPDLYVVLGNVFMLSTLQGFIVNSMLGNTVVWSLSFEMFFYILFTFSIGRHQKKFLRAWFVVAALLIPFCYLPTHIGVIDHIVAMMAFSCIWLVGYYIYEYRDAFYADGYGAALSLGSLAIMSRVEFPWQWPGTDPFKHLLFAFVAIPFFRFCLQTKPAGKKVPLSLQVLVYLMLSAALILRKDSNLPTKVICCALPLVLIAGYWFILRINSKERVIVWVDRLGAVLGKYSYSLYIGHMPVLVVLAWYFMGHFVEYVLLSVAGMSLLAWFMESLYQPWIAGLLKKKPKNEQKSLDGSPVAVPAGRPSADDVA